MNKTEQLFVRACKSGGGLKRVKSVYRRFYLNDQNVDFFIAGVLSRIADKYLDLKSSDFIDGLNPANAWKCGIEKDDSYHTGVVKFLISEIRCTEKDKFPGIVPPAVFRKPPYVAASA
ncbi:MAG: hypothetical protein C9356_20345 [Oleiphilus sp.]|nr:MAG: hypothetical protein C9356_20345 [Oleiphilus sp.]